VILDEHGKAITYHEEDGKVFVRYHTPDIQALLDSNAEARATEPGKFEKKQEWRKVFSVDQVTVMEIERKYGLDFFNPDDAKTILKILSGPDYQKFRTTNRPL
jgi:hypothetical protein